MTGNLSDEHAVVRPFKTLIRLLTGWGELHTRLGGFEFAVMRLVFQLANLEGQTLVVSTSGLSEIFNLSSSTSIRLMKIMTEEGLIAFSECDRDQLRIELTCAGARLAEGLATQFLALRDDVGSPH